ncbi:hypothetical protein [Mesorhizobium sp. M4B.F.Ca.ET.049.02.1.2]|uniref:hypothetical protein n=1 Tax=Mesorhizobium sp. M4B.F.Ca.ET.049.02.1.2 TaxID=2496752 RepID=UPI00167AC10A|nr:hypothetical protein [Mesorhizobium sp. M4B.F.Ca.ET.049.02.1.2]
MLAVPRQSTLACSLSGDAFQAANSATKGVVSPFIDAHLSCPFLPITIIAVPVTPYPIAAIRSTQVSPSMRTSNRTDPAVFFRGVSYTITERSIEAALDVAE